MSRQDLAEITRVWQRQELTVLERSPRLYQEIRAAIDEGRDSVVILNLIDAALDRTPTPASVVSAATQAFDHLRMQVTSEERAEFVALLSNVNRGLDRPEALKRRLLWLAVAHHATGLLSGTYFDGVRGADAAGV